MAQIYRWFSTRQASEVLYTQGVLMNKLMYYAAESVRAVNPHFKIDTGWYLYGPCYESGRVYDVEGRSPLSVVPMTDTCSAEVAAACESVYALWQQALNDRCSGTFAAFVKRIYTQKCDHSELQRYYLAKHDLQMCFHVNPGRPVTPYESPSRDEAMRVVEHFDRALLASRYPNFVGLQESRVDAIVEGNAFIADYVDRVSNEQARSEAADQAMADWISRVLVGLAHLSYAATFESTKPAHVTNVQTRHRSLADEMLSTIETDVERLGDALMKVGAAL
jgi:hypothetical protein